MNIRFFLFVLLAFAQLATPLYFAEREEMTLARGHLFKFKTAVVDPVDLFRGGYVALGFDAALLPAPVAQQLDDGLKERAQKNDVPVYVTFEENAEGYAEIASVSEQKPASSRDETLRLNLRRAMQWNPAVKHAEEAWRVTLPFNRFYMQADQALTAQKVLNRRRRIDTKAAYALVALYREHATIKDVYVEEMPILDYLQSPAAQEGASPVKVAVHPPPSPPAPVDFPAPSATNAPPPVATVPVAAPMAPAPSPATPIAVPAQNPPDPRLEKALQDFSQFYVGLQSFKARVVLKDGVDRAGTQIMMRESSYLLAMSRPNSFALTTEIGKPDGAVVSDGQTLIVYQGISHRYTSQTAPSEVASLANPVTLSLALMHGFSGLTCVISPNPINVLIGRHGPGTYMGEETIDGHPTDHLRFSRFPSLTVDFWIAKGETPLLVQVVETHVAGTATFTNTEVYSDWQINPPLPADTFVFQPPANATQVSDLRAPLRPAPSPPNGQLPPAIEATPNGERFEPVPASP